MLNRYLPVVPAILLLFSLTIQPVFAQDQWILKKEQNGIRVYTSGVPGSLFKAFRSVCIINSSSLEEVTAAVIDVENYDQLFPDTKEVLVLEKKSDGHFIHYMITDAPWPVEDRDGIYELKAGKHPDKRSVSADINCIRHPYPMKKGVVRMNRGEGRWEITELIKGQVEVRYQYHGEPEGNVPAWLANTSVVSIPFQTLKNLKKMIASGKYKNADVSFIH